MGFSSIMTPMMVYYMACYAVIGVYQSYSSLYFAGRGLDYRLIGTLQAAAPLIAIAAQPFWGYMADRASDRRRVLRLLLLGAAAAVALYPLEQGFVLLLLGVALFALFQTSLQPLSDSIVLDSLNAQGKPFGPLRISGTLAFALTVLICGWCLEGREVFFPWVTALLILAAFAASFTLPRQKQRPSPGPPHPFALVKDHQLMGLLLLIGVMQITMGFYFSFFPVYFTQTLGGSQKLLGLAYLIGTLSELPFLLKGDRLLNRWGTGVLLCVAAVAMLLRWLALALLPTLHWALLLQPLMGGGFIVMMFTMAKTIALKVPPALISSGQTLLGMVSYGLARVIGSFAGGMVYQRWGPQVLFFVGALLALGALVGLVLLTKRENLRP